MKRATGSSSSERGRLRSCRRMGWPWRLVGTERNTPAVAVSLGGAEGRGFGGRSSKGGGGEAEHAIAGRRTISPGQWEKTCRTSPALRCAQVRTARPVETARPIWLSSRAWASIEHQQAARGAPRKTRAAPVCSGRRRRRLIRRSARSLHVGYLAKGPATAVSPGPRLQPS